MGIILNTDSYKLTHWKQLPKGIIKTKTYYESRKVFSGYGDVFFGLQYVLRNSGLTRKITKEEIKKAKEFSLAHFGQEVFNEKGWEDLEKLGYLPIRIKAVPEGSVISPGNVLFTVENTHPDFAWLTNVIEPMLMHVWYPITVASNSYRARKLIEKYHKATGDYDEQTIGFSLHDFGTRGVTCMEQAAIGGAAHLTSFIGSDNIPGITMLDQDYNYAHTSRVNGFSVPATEHSTMTIWGKEGEMDSVDHLLNTFSTGILSVVSDSFNVFNFVDEATTKFKDRILARDGKMVFRPDSGDMRVVVPKLLNILWKNIGGTLTETGHKKLNPKVGLLQGDGINYDTLAELLEVIEKAGFCTSNVVFGSGGGLLQMFNRDDTGAAIKACYGERQTEEGLEILNYQKDPVTSKSKKSKKGDLKLIKETTGEYRTISSADMSKEQFEGYIDQLEIVFEDGVITRHHSIEDIRRRLWT